MPKDYLTSLPAELFDYICDLVVIAKPKQYLGGISKAFLPSARERTFWSVHIYKEPAAIRFVEALAASPGAASHVRYLTLHLPETAFSSEAAAPVLRRAISHLRNVRQICLTGACELSKMLLSPTSPKTLPELTQLSISSRLTGWFSPFSPRHYHTLRYYFRLYALDLHILRSAPARRSSRMPQIECIAMPASFGWLTLGGTAKDTPDADLLVHAFCPEVLSFEAREGDDTPMSARLQQLPRSVRRLKLRQNLPQLEDLTAVLPNLRQITGLSLSSSFDCAAILPLLANELPQLDKLELEANESLTSQLLIQILSGPKKIVKLRTLSLSTSYGSRSSVHASLAPKALIEVVELAEQEKVEVSGGRFWDAIDARKARDARLEAEEEERREIARAIARRAART